MRKIKNTELKNIGRASNLVWLIFSDDREPNREYALHIQCPWRICDEKQYILLASDDIYQPNSSMERSEDFDWDSFGNSLFDEKIHLLFPEEERIFVKQISFSRRNDFKIVFSNNLILEAFIDTSLKDSECWRFFERGNKDKHLVVFGNYKELQ